MFKHSSHFNSLLLLFSSPSLSRRLLCFSQRAQPFFSVLLQLNGALQYILRKGGWRVPQSSEEEKAGRVWGCIKIKWESGTMILTAGGNSQPLIKRATIKNMKTQVSRGLLILFQCFVTIWLYGTILKYHFIVLWNDRGSSLTKWSSWRDKADKEYLAAIHHI